MLMFEVHAAGRGFGISFYLRFTFRITAPPGFPGGSEVKASASNAEDPGSIPESGRSPGEGNGNPLQCSHLENPRDRAAWWAAIYGVAQSQLHMTEAT